MQSLPAGVSGLMVTAIFAAAMSSVDSGINSISTVIVNDLVKPMRRSPGTDRGALVLARCLTVLLGAVATLAALGAASIGNIVKMWMNVMGFFAAPILSLFVLGLLTRRASFRGWLLGLVCGMGLTVFLKLYFGEQLMPIWLIPSSFMVCSIIGYGASVLIPGSGRIDAGASDQ